MKNLSTTQKALIGVALAAGGYLAYKKFAGGSAALPPAGESSVTQPGEAALPSDQRLSDPETKANYLTLLNAYNTNTGHKYVDPNGKWTSVSKTKDQIDSIAARLGTTPQEVMINRAAWLGGKPDIEIKAISGLGNYNVADMLG